MKSKKGSYNSPTRRRRTLFGLKFESSEKIIKSLKKGTPRRKKKLLLISVQLAKFGRMVIQTSAIRASRTAIVSTIRVKKLASLHSIISNPFLRQP